MDPANYPDFNKFEGAGSLDQAVFNLLNECDDPDMPNDEGKPPPPIIDLVQCRIEALHREAGDGVLWEFGGDREYYLASAADRVYLLPSSPLDLTGVASYEIFLRGTFDKLGVQPDFLRIGDYKTAPNQLTEKEMTPGASRDDRVDQPRHLRPSGEGDRRGAQADRRPRCAR